MGTEKRKNLYELLMGMVDKRRRQGRRHSLAIILLLIIMGVMNGGKSERGISRFVENNSEELIEVLQIKKKRLPTRNILRGILQGIEFEELEKIFYEWAQKYVPIEKSEWISIDGKGINGTITNASNSGQNFKSLVSVFASKRKQILASSMLETKKKNEIPVVKELIESLDLKGVIFSLDALHCQKETIKKIVESKNDYVIGVKKNQPKLLSQIKKTL